MNGQGDDSREWAMTRIGAGHPLVPALMADNRPKYAEDPVNPAAEAINALRPRARNITILVTPPCSMATYEGLRGELPRLKKIVVVDWEPRRLAAWRAATTVNPNLFQIISVAAVSKLDLKITLQRKLADVRDDLALGAAAVHVPARFRRLDRSFADALAETLLLIQRETSSAAANKTASSWRKTCNQFINLRHRPVHLAPVANPDARLEAAIIVGAGPSLDKNAEQLRRVPPSAIVVACDASLGALSRHGVEPDFIVSLEHSLSWRFFVDHLDVCARVPLIVPFEADHVTVRHYPGPVILVANRNLPECFGDAGDALTRLTYGQCVGHLAFHVAETLNPERIVMIGFDLAFTDDQTHTKDVDVHLDDSFSEQFSYLETTGIDGKPVKTELSLHFFKTYFEEQIKSIEIPVVDATEGGALIEGARVATLAETLNGLRGDDDVVPLSELALNAPFNHFDVSTWRAEIHGELQWCRNHLVESRSKTERMTPDSISNPLRGLTERERIFPLLASCCSELMLTRFREIISNFDSERFSEFHDVLTCLLDEFSEAIDLLNPLLEFPLAVHEAATNSPLMIVPKAPDDVTRDLLQRPAFKDLRRLDSAASLSVIWRDTLAHKPTTLITFNGDIIPDAWTAPEITCHDVKTTCEKHSYENFLWQPGYVIAPIDGDTADYWQSTAPADVPLIRLSDLEASLRLP